MKKWSIETAKKYIELAEKGRKEKGLTYLSAKDYIKNHGTLASMCKHSIISL